MDEYTMSWSDAVRAEAASAELRSGPSPRPDGDDVGSSLRWEPPFTASAQPTAAQPTCLQAIVERLRSGNR